MVDRPTAVLVPPPGREQTQVFLASPFREGEPLLLTQLGAKGLTAREAVFSPFMAGDIIRIITEGVEQVRTILTATAYKLTWDMADVRAGSSFVIGPRRLCLRPAPLHGAAEETVKTFQGGIVRAFPTVRPSAETLDVRAYVNYAALPAETRTVKVFPQGEVGFSLEDRVASLGQQGRALEVELVSLESENDFDLQSFSMLVQEEPDERSEL